MSTPNSRAGSPAFYTVKEAAELLRVDPATLYRAIRDESFPAVRLRSRYVVPAAALDDIVAEVTKSGAVVDVSRLLADRRAARDVARLSGGEWR